MHIHVGADDDKHRAAWCISASYNDPLSGIGVRRVGQAAVARRDRFTTLVAAARPLRAAAI
jgi:hypothetical protein